LFIVDTCAWTATGKAAVGPGGSSVADLAAPAAAGAAKATASTSSAQQPRRKYDTQDLTYIISTQ